MEIPFAEVLQAPGRLLQQEYMLQGTNFAERILTIIASGDLCIFMIAKLTANVFPRTEPC